MYNIINLLLAAVLFTLSSSIHALTFDQSQDILDLLKEEKYEQLETVLSEYFDKYSVSRAGERDVIQALETLYNAQPWMAEKIEKWINSSPESYLPYLYLGAYHFRAGWVQRGEKILSEADNKQIDRMTYHHNNAKLNFKKALNIEPSLVQAYAYLVSMAMHSRNKTELDSYYKKGVAINPYYQRLQLYYSSSLMPRWGGSLEELKEFSEEMVVLSLKNPNLKPLIGLPDIEIGDQLLFSSAPEKALKQYKKAEKYGGYWYLYLRMGEAYMKMHEPDLALAQFEKLAYIRPMYAKAYDNISQLYLVKDQYGEAKKYNQLCRQLDPRNFEYVTMEAQLAYNTGDYEAALEAAREAGEIRPDNNRIKGFIALINMRLKSAKKEK